jgi:hypothetical protein
MDAQLPAWGGEYFLPWGSVANRIVIPDVSKFELLNILLLGPDGPLNAQCQIQFYGNSPVLGPATIPADFTAVVCPGIGAYTLTGATFDDIEWADIVAYKFDQIDPTCSATPGSPVNAIGYWVTSTLSGALLWCQQFDQPFTWTNMGDIMLFTPKLGCGQLLYTPPKRSIMPIDAFAQVVWGSPSLPVAGVITVPISLVDGEGNTLVTDWCDIELKVTDSETSSEVSATSTLGPAGVPSGIYLSTPGNARATMRSAAGLYSIAVVEPTPGHIRWLYAGQTIGSQFWTKAAGVPLQLNF